MAIMDSDSIPGSAADEFENSTTTIGGGVYSINITESYEKMESEGRNGSDVVMFLFVALVLGWFLQCTVKRLLRVIPYTAIIFILGLGLGVLDHFFNLGTISKALEVWTIDYQESGAKRRGIDPDFFLYIFLPVLIFGDLFSSDTHTFVRSTPQCLVLAFPGVVLSTYLFGVVCYYIYPFDWSWNLSCAFGAMISATDPVAVLATMKRFGVKKRILNLISGESIMNDGSSIVLFTLYISLMIPNEEMSTKEIVAFVFKSTLGSGSFGMLWGIVGLIAIRLSQRKKIMITTLTLALPYLAYYTAAILLEMSGVITLVPLGVLIGFGCQIFTGSEIHDYLGSIWEFLEFCANTLVFFLSGILVAEDFFLYDSTPVKWAYILLTYAFTQVIRFIVIFLFYPLLTRISPGLSFKEALLAWWGGLRGAVGLALAIALKLKAQYIVGNQRQAHEAAFFMSGVVIITLLLNSTTTELLIRLLGLADPTHAQLKVMNEIEKKIKVIFNGIMSFAMNEMKQPYALTDVSRSNAPESEVNLHRVSQELVERTVIKEKRFRFILTMKRRVVILHNYHLISEFATQVLLLACNSSLERTDQYLDVWNGVLGMITNTWLVDTYAEDLNNHPDNIFYKARDIVIRKWLLLACEIAHAFLCANEEGRKAVYQLNSRGAFQHEAISVLAESVDQCKPAATFLNQVRDKCPTILSSLKARQVRHACQMYASQEVLNHEVSGVIEYKERTQLLTSIRKMCDEMRSQQLPLLGEEFTADCKLEEHIDLYPFGMKVPENESFMDRSFIDESMTEEPVNMAQVMHSDTLHTTINLRTLPEGLDESNHKVD